jgi:putative methyltransferase (TIGR04325 family)
LNKCLPSWIKFQGVYSSFDEARAHAPKGVRFGYDHEEIATAYQGQTFLPSDYPAIFWMHEALQDGSRIFDFGGSVGVSFYLWQKYFRYPNNIEWLVCDLPAVVQAGQKLANEKNENRLRFTSCFEDANGFDFVLMSGCLQYIETPASEFLQKLKRLPRHLLINRVPLHRSRQCVTLQNIRWMVSPYQIFLRDRFIASLEALGYKLLDMWPDADHTCWIPFYPEYSVEAYSGLYFRCDV